MLLTELFSQHKKVFITGTDTEVGKTFCACLIVKHLMQQKLDVFPFKPISAGTQEFQDGLQTTMVNEDALSLYNAVEKRYSLAQINPIVYQQPIAPHIAAQIEQQTLNFEMLDFEFNKITTLGDVQLIEGAGGWHLPLNNQEILSDWVAENNLPVIMVVGIKLGCLNHALLTAQAIESSGCKLVGWIANFIDGETDINRKNVEFIQQKLTVPLLTQVQRDQCSFYLHPNSPISNNDKCDNTGKTI